MSAALREAVTRQRLLLHGRLATPLERLARDCAGQWPHRQRLEQLLLDAFPGLPSCKYLYCLDANADQITANCTRSGLDESHLGRNRRDRPYMSDALAGQRLSLSQAYISRNETFYLRSGSLNIFNGIVGLNFSCDGSHYMPWDELLKKSLGFWIGTGDTDALEPRAG